MSQKIPRNAFSKKGDALKVLNELEKYRYGEVEKVVKKRKSEPPPLLHSLTTLQREANKLFGFSADKTLKIAQKLYEERKVISYPRTDSQHLATSNISLVKEILKKLGKENLIPAVEKVGKRVFNDAKLTDHHAIIPLEPPPSDLSPDEKKIYNLIWRRFVGAFMPPYVYETTTVILRVGRYRFGAKGKVDIFLAWKALYKEKEKTENSLPPLQKGEKVEKKKELLEEKKTQPPPRYTEGTLLKVMEKFGLGTPATRAQIIETLKRRDYLKVVKKNLVPTEKADRLIELLSASKVSSPEMTAEWERKLEEIHLKRLGRKGYETFLRAIKNFTAEEIKRLKGSLPASVSVSPNGNGKKEATPKMIKLAKTLAKELGVEPPKTNDFDEVKAFVDKALKEKREKPKAQTQKVVGKCRCGGEVVELPKSYKCQKCGTTVWKETFGKRLTLKQVLELFAGKETAVKGLKGKSGKRFNAKLKLEDGKVKIAGWLT